MTVLLASDPDCVAQGERFVTMSSDSDSNCVSLLPRREICVHTKCYCEENVWKLCHYIQEEKPAEVTNCYAVFISNTKQAVPIWHQKACHNAEQPVVWDYHVIFIHSGVKESSVYDLDTNLEFPVKFDVYLAHAIRLNEALKEDYHRFFRVVPASLYLTTFSSDRSHMCREDKSWISPPPDYPCIQTPDVSTNLKEFMKMEMHTGHGQVMALNQLVERFGDLCNYRKLALEHYQS